MENKNYFNVDVFGDYFVAGASGNTVKPFPRVTLRLPVWENCQNLVRKHILPKLLRDADSGFASMRKCIVEQVTTPDGQQVHGLPLVFMSRTQIDMEARSKGIPLRVDMYPDIIDLRGKLRKARADIEKFKKEEIRHSAAYNKIGDAMAMNEHVFDSLRAANDTNVVKPNSVEPPRNSMQQGVDDLRDSINKQFPMPSEQTNYGGGVSELPPKEEDESKEPTDEGLYAL